MLTRNGGILIMKKQAPTLGLAITCLLLIAAQIMFFAVIEPGDGDDGAYVAFAYQGMKGAIPYLDFWYQQGIGYTTIIGSLTKLFGPTLLGQRLIFAMFSLLSLPYLILFAKQFFDARHIPRRPAYWLILGGLGVVSVDIWHWMARIGTKSSFVEFLLIGFLYHLTQGLHSRKNWPVIISAVFAGALISSKYNFIFVPVFAAALIFFYADRRLKTLLYFSLTLATVTAAFFLPILSLPGIEAFRLSMEYTRNEYIIPSARMNIFQRFKTVVDLFSYDVLKYFVLVPAIVFISARIKLRPELKERANIWVVALIGVGITNIAANSVLLFPRLSTMHHDASYIPLVLGFMLLAFALWEKASPSPDSILKPKLPIILGAISIFLINCHLLAGFDQIGYGRFAKFTSLQRFKEVMLGKNQVVEILDQLQQEFGYDSYVHLGRANFYSIASSMRQDPACASGTGIMESQGDLDREIINRLRTTSATNLPDLFTKHHVVVLERFNFQPGFRQQTLTRELDSFHFQSLYNDGYFEVLVRHEIPGTRTSARAP